MLRVETQLEKFAGLNGRIRAHHFNYAYPGEQAECIWHVIGGGANAKLEVGADVMGHGHVHPEFIEHIVIGAKEVYYTKDGRAVTVKLEQIDGLPSSFSGEGMINQDREDELGYLFFGKVVCLEVPLKKGNK